MHEQAGMLQFIEHVRCRQSRIHLKEPDASLSQNKIDSEHAANAGAIGKDSRDRQHLFSHLVAGIDRTDIAAEQKFGRTQARPADELQ